MTPASDPSKMSEALVFARQVVGSTWNALSLDHVCSRNLEECLKVIDAALLPPAKSPGTQEGAGESERALRSARQKCYEIWQGATALSPKSAAHDAMREIDTALAALSASLSQPEQARLYSLPELRSLLARHAQSLPESQGFHPTVTAWDLLDTLGNQAPETPQCSASVESAPQPAPSQPEQAKACPLCSGSGKAAVYLNTEHLYDAPSPTSPEAGKSQPHPLSMPGARTGAMGMQSGDRIVGPGGKTGRADEFLPDGEVFVSWDDGTYATLKWGQITPSPDAGEGRQPAAARKGGEADHG